MSELTTKPKKSPKSELERLSDILELMKQSGVHKFKFKDIEVEFEVQLGGGVKVLPDNIDDETERLNAIRKVIKEEINEEDANLLWSSQP